MRLRGFLWAMVLSTGLGLSACKEKPAAPANPSRSLAVFAAASLTESFRELGGRFEARHPGTRVVFNFAGSQQLREQLANGAPADLFASANRKEMDGALSASLVDGSTVRIFARNTLIVIYPRNNPANIGALADLARSGIKLDLADPSVPVGKYAMQMLDALANDPVFGSNFKAGALANVVSREDNVKSVVTKVRLGEADAGVVYASDVVGDAARDVGVLTVPTRYNQMAQYPIAVTAHAAQADLARQFEDFVISAEGQEVLKAYGFIPATTERATP